MPKKPMKQCRYPGCPNLTDGMYCETHQKLADRQYDKYQRNPAHKERYGTAGWKNLRKLQLERQPLCESCMKEGRYTKAVTAHHIVPLNEGGANDLGNLCSLCGPCHSRLHAKRGDRWHNRKPSAQ